MGISSILGTDTHTYLSCFVLPPLLPSWLLPSLSPLDPQLTDPLPQLMPPLLTTLLLMANPSMKHQNPMLSNTVFPMTTPEPNSTLKRPLTAKLSPDNTKLLFPMVVSKPSPTPLITTTVMSLMSNTKVSPSTLRPNLTYLPQGPDITLKKLSKTEVANNYL